MDQFDIQANTIALESHAFQQRFGFRNHPFAGRVNGSDAILLPGQTVARDAIVDAIKAGDNIIVFTGPSGIGKTIVMENVVGVIHDEYQVLFVNPVDFKKEDGLIGLISRINKGQHKVRFIVEDASALTIDMIKEFKKLLDSYQLEGIQHQAIFVGRPNFLDMLRHRDLEHLNNKVNSFIVLPPMEEPAIHEYMAMKLNLAGISSSQVMTPRAVRTIARASHGSPGILNSLATGSLRNAVHNRHRKVNFEDATLAVRSPNVPPDIAYGWLRRHRMAVFYGVSLTAFLAAGIYIGTRPWFSQVTSETRIFVADAIDFFSDHTAQESPQIPIVDSNIPQTKVFDDTAQQKALAEQRSRLLDQLDKEARGNGDLTATTSNTVGQPTNLVPLVPLISRSIKKPAPESLPNTEQQILSTDQPAPATSKPTLLSAKPTTDPTVKINPAQPVAAVPVQTSTPPTQPYTAHTQGVVKAQPPPPLPPQNVHPGQPAPHPTQAAKPVVTHSLPEFCARLTPTTEAGLAYKKRVCVPGNVHGDIYYERR